MKMIEVQDINKVYKSEYSNEGTHAIKDVSLSIENGQTVAIMGSSGCGKTTLINIIAGIDLPDSGYVSVDSKFINYLDSENRALFRRENIGLILQQDMLLNDLTVFENINLLLIEEKRDRLNDLIKYFKIERLMNKYPYELSSGEKQKVNACRAFANNQKIILADEPTGNLDSKSSKQFIDFIVELNKKNKNTFLMVTHDMFIASYCERVIFMKDGEIKIDIYKKEDRKAFLDRIFDCMLLLEGEINEYGKNYL